MFAAIFVPIVVLLGMAAAIGIVIKQRQDFMPKLFYSTIGVKFAQGADEHQEGLPEFCLALAELVHEKHGRVADELLSKLIIEVNGKDAVMTSFSIPSGHVYHSDGTEAILLGTTDTHRPSPLEAPRFVVKVRQRVRSDGVLVDIIHTAAAHEICEHVLPKLVENDWNGAHVVKWTLVTHELEARYRAEMAITHPVTPKK